MSVLNNRLDAVRLQAARENLSLTEVFARFYNSGVADERKRIVAWLRRYSAACAQEGETRRTKHEDFWSGGRDGFDFPERYISLDCLEFNCATLADLIERGET